MIVLDNDVDLEVNTMRLGAQIEGYSSGEEWARKHIEKGLSAAYWPLPDDATDVVIDEFLAAASRHDIVIAEVGIWNNLLDPDLAKREDNLRTAIRRLKTAERVGARCCVNISGSRSAIWDGPHPDNLTRETFGTIVSITQKIIDTVSPKRTCYTLEPMPWMYPCDTQTLLQLIRAVNRPAFAAHADMCNLINSYEKVYHNDALTREFFTYIKPYIRSVHVKDTTIDPSQLTLHINEALPGTGLFDYDELLIQCAQLDDMPLMIEHLRTESEYDQAITFIRRKADQLGLAFTEGR